jgi:hypothetical protein
MHPHLVSSLDHLDEATRNLRAAVDAVPVPLRSQKPAPGRWSVDEVVEHLGKVEQIFFTALSANIESAKAAGLPPEVDAPPLLPDQVRTRLTDRSNPRNAPEPAQPTGTVDALTGLQIIEAGHARLKDLLESCHGLALSTVTHDHRFFGTLNVYQWLELMAGHEGRHTQQIREITEQVVS